MSTGVYRRETGRSARLFAMLHRHEARLTTNPNVALQVNNLARLTNVHEQAVNERATAIRRCEIVFAPTL